MAYNRRMSVLPTPQQSHQRKTSASNYAPPPAPQQSRKKEEYVDVFILTDKEIIGCISDIGIHFTLENLQKPNPAQVQQIYEWFAELLLNVNRETVDPAMRSAAYDICGDYSDIVPPDTRNLLGFFIKLRELLLICGIDDFSFNDLYKPTHRRFAKILSYVINFIRFRENHTDLIHELYTKTQDVKTRIDILRTENLEKEEQLGGLRRTSESVKSQVEEKQNRNYELKVRLLELRREQENIIAQVEDVKKRRNDLASEFQLKHTEKLQVQDECKKLQPYVTQSAATLEDNLADLNAKLAFTRSQIDALDWRSRALQTSKDSFSSVANDVLASIRMLEDIGEDLAREEEENARHTRQREKLADGGKQVRDKEREEQVLQHQLAKWTERTERLREQSTTKAREAKAKMDELRERHRQLTEERTERANDMERRRVRIEQTEKKMWDLKENIEQEVHAAYDEYLKMAAHVKMYINEMEQVI